MIKIINMNKMIKIIKIIKMIKMIKNIRILDLKIIRNKELLLIQKITKF